MNNQYIFKHIVKFLCFMLLLLSLALDGFSQNQIFKGKLKDSNGSAVQNAIISVINKPDEITMSNQDGEFVINGQIDQYIKIRVSGVYQKTVRIKSESMTITLSDNDEYFPVGYGIVQPKEEMTMTAGMVNSVQLSKNSSISPANALYGKIAGLTVLQNGGTSGTDDPDMLMRVAGTTRSNNLLILVDGFERPLSYFALSEIESVVLLKDAASLALYGLRGANGVLQVTTKMNNGLNQKPRISISYEKGITTPFRKPTFLDSYGYANAYNEALTNDGLPKKYTPSDLANYKSGASPYFYPNIKWFDEAFRDFGQRDAFNISFSGSNKSLKYLTLLDYQNDDGLLKPANMNDGYSTQYKFSRLNLRTNLDIDVTASTKLMIRVGGTLIDNNRPSETESNIMNAIYSIPSNAFPVKTYNNDWGGTSIYDNNPVAMIAAKGYSVYRTRGVMADIRLEQKLDAVLKGLSLEGAYSNDNLIERKDSKTQNFAYTQIGLVKDQSTGMVTDTVVTSYGQKTTLAFGTSVTGLRKGTTMMGKIKYNKEWGNNTINSAILYQQDQLILQNRYNTFLHQIIASNIHYSKNGKYFADIALSYSGTNLLNKSNRFGFFPAASLAWNITKEKWYNGYNTIDNLKVRASWGITGNDLVPQNMDIPINAGATGYRFGSGNTSFGGWSEGELSPGNLSFEKSYKTSLGLDATIFKKIDLSINAYYDTRKDILTTAIGTISNVIGNSTAYKMGGTVIDKGIDADISFQDGYGDFKYYLAGQFSYGKNQIVEMFEEYRPYEYLKRTGKSINQTFGMEAIGFFKDLSDVTASPVQRFAIVKPGDVKYKDQNDDGIIDEFDEVPLGYNTLFPEINYSGSIGLQYKGVGFDLLVQGIANYSVYANTRNIFWPLYGNTNISTFSNNRWTPETGAKATLPILSTNQNLNNYRSNSIWVLDGSYFKIRSVEFYYDIAKEITSKLKIAKARIYLRGMNLFSHDHINIVDPEEIGMAYPTLSSYHLGIKLGF